MSESYFSDPDPILADIELSELRDQGITGTHVDNLYKTLGTLFKKGDTELQIPFGDENLEVTLEPGSNPEMTRKERIIRTLGRWVGIKEVEAPAAPDTYILNFNPREPAPLRSITLLPDPSDAVIRVISPIAVGLDQQVRELTPQEANDLVADVLETVRDAPGES